MSAAEQIRWGREYILRVYGTAAEDPRWYERGGALPDKPPDDGGGAS